MTAAPESRPRRDTQRGRVRREQILQVATEKFLAQGFAGVSVDDIVRDVGGSKTSVYSHFGNKEGLFVAVIEALCDEFLQDVKHIDITGLDAEAGLQCFGRALLQSLLQERHIDFQRLVIAESKRFQALGQAWFDRGPQQSRALIARFIDGRQRAGELRPADPAVAATLFHDMLVFNPTHLATIGRAPDAEALERHVQQVVAFCVRRLSSGG